MGDWGISQNHMYNTNTHNQINLFKTKYGRHAQRTCQTK